MELRMGQISHSLMFRLLNDAGLMGELQQRADRAGITLQEAAQSVKVAVQLQFVGPHAEALARDS